MSKVQLIALTSPMIGEGGDFLTAEQFIAYCARVSNPTNQLNHDTADKLVAYLAKHQHWSPFEMVHATISIETTRDIARQILRHRSFSFQEFSQRYAQVQAEPVIRETRLQDDKNRQNSLEVEDDSLHEMWKALQHEIAEKTQLAYDIALSHGIAKEVARSVLPEGLTQSHLYMSGTLRSWIHYIQLRTGNGTQKEHREIAKQCRDALLPHFQSLKGLFNGE